MGNPRLPTELKKLKGTLNTTREKQNPGADTVIAETSVILPEQTKLSCPRWIENRVVKKFWKEEIKNLLTLRVLSRVDLHQLEELCVILQQLYNVRDQLLSTDVDSEEYDLVEKRYERIGRRFDELANKFYISPAARTQLKLNDLALVKTAQEIQKNDNAITALLNDRNER